MINLISSELYVDEQYQTNRLGEIGIDRHGNKYRYVKVGGSNLVHANLLQEPAEDTNFLSMAVPAAYAIGVSQITVTLGGTAVTANMFDEGVAIVSTSTGIGQKFYIKSHSVQTSTTGVLTLNLDRGLRIALTTGSKVTIRKNPYNGVIQYPVTTQTGGAVGFAMQANTAAYYTWIQSGGDTAVLFDNGTNSANGASAIAPSAAVAGSVAPVLDAVGAIVLGYSRAVASVDSTVMLARVIID